MKCFFHVYPVADYEKIVCEIEDLLRHVPCEVTRIAGDQEIHTLEALWAHAIHSTGRGIDAFEPMLYVHTKGVTKTGEMRECVDDWRRLMEYFMLERWNECVEKIDYSTGAYNVAGVCWKPMPMRHYSGNFWWTNAAYVRSLMRPKLWQERLKGHPSAPEFWIGSNPEVKAYSFMDSGINHYQERYPRERYATQL